MKHNYLILAMAMSAAGCGQFQLPTPERLASIACEPGNEIEMMGALLDYARANELTTLSSTDLANGRFSVSVLVRVDSVSVDRSGDGDYVISFMPHFADMNPDGHDDQVAQAKRGVVDAVRQHCSADETSVRDIG